MSFDETGYQTVDGAGGGGAGSNQASSSSRALSSSPASSSSSVAGSGGSAGGGGPCSVVSDCGAPPDPCVEIACVDQQCTLSASSPETPCSDGGAVCDGQGHCVGCVVASDCPAEECQTAACGADHTCDYQPDNGGACGTGLQCVDGSCIGCTTDQQCSSPSSCLVPLCDTSTGACGTSPAEAGTACTSGDSQAKFCDAMGACTLQCEVASDCAPPPACQLVTCNAGMCQTSNDALGTSCTGGVCDGSGSCVACNVNADCPVCSTCDGTTHTCNAVAEGAQESGLCDDQSGACGAPKCACSGAPLASCKRKNGQPCATASQCATNRCPLSLQQCGLPSGSMCAQGSDCASSHCTGGVCQ